MKKIVVAAVFLVMTSGVCFGDYDYYTKRDPQTCADVMIWSQELAEESHRLEKLHAELSEQKEEKKEGDKELDFHKMESLKSQQSLLNDEYNAMKEAKKRLCQK